MAKISLVFFFVTHFFNPIYKRVMGLSIFSLTTFWGPFLMVFGITIFVPLLPGLSIYFDVSPGVIGLIPMAGNLGLLFFTFLWGYLSDRKDPLDLYVYALQFWIFGLVLGFIGLLLLSFPLTLLGRSIQGAAEGGMYFLGLRILERYAPILERPRYSGRLEISAAVGGISGPIVGVLVPNPFLGLGVLLSIGTVGLILILMALKNSPRPTDPIRSLQKDPIVTPRIVSLIPLVMVGFSIFFAFGVIITFLGFLFERFALPGAYAGWLASGAQIILAFSSFLAGKYTLHRISVRKCILVGLFLLVIGFYFLGLSQSITVSVLLVLGVFFLFGHVIPAGSLYSFAIAQKIGAFTLTLYMIFRSLGQLLSVQHLSFSFLDATVIDMFESTFRYVYHTTGIVVFLEFALVLLIRK
jgi:MFS family permease